MTGGAARDPILETLTERLGAQYAFDGLLGQGGMGSVYRARDLTLDRPVAIKVIGGDVATNPQLRDRFLQEARTVAKLRHPNIVAVYSAGDAGGLLYFAMELVPGESLRELLTREGKVERSRGERILHELALALDYAHANGIVHRDVKPENILLDRETGRAMLMDFGVARALEGDGRMTGTGMILGSPRYMSPEQATGEATLDGRSDLYALALVGYEMYTGKPVVESSNVAGMLVKHLTETPRPLADAVSDVPEGVATAIDRALVKDREKRWANGRAMADAIGMSWTPTAGTSGSGSRTTIGYRFPRTAAARRRAMIAGALLLGLVGWATVSLMRRDGAPRGVDPRRSYAVMPFEVQTSNRDVQWLRDGAVNMLTLALSQWRDLTVADYERTMVLVRDAGLEDKRVDLDRALAIARRAGAWTVVTGTISTTADSLRVDARLYDVASGKPLTTETRLAALTEDPRALFDGLARYLLGVAGGNATESVDLAAATTKSIVAYRAYLEGVRQLQTWRLKEADSLFQVAVRADSTFALAWHKRSLALGWGDAGGKAYVESSDRAAALASRLPAREQALVRGHHALSRGLQSSAEGRAKLREAQGIYRDLIARDSGVAEAWYGYADALYHVGFDADSLAASAARFTGAIRAFNHTLALDSTFHLAYSHLVQMHQQFSSSGNNFVLDGDSVRYFPDSASLKRAGGVAGVVAMQNRARDRGLALAESWMRADAGAITPTSTLVFGLFAAGKPDSAVKVVDAAMARSEFRTKEREFWAGTYRFLADDPRGTPGLMEAVRTADPAALRRESTTDRFNGMMTAIAAAGASGNSANVERAAKLLVMVDSVIPGSGKPMAPVAHWFSTALLAAQRGELLREDRAVLLRGIREGEASGQFSEFRGAANTIAYLGYLLTHDTAFSGAVRRMGGPQARWPELDASAALERGDTAAARTFAAQFTRADSVAKSRLGMAGMRTVLRAEVIAALGDPKEAAAQYAALHPSRFNTAPFDPGFTVYVRSFAARARLYEQMGERDQAIGAWEEFLRRWKDGDAITEPARREARAAVQRLRDQPTTRRP